MIKHLPPPTEAEEYRNVAEILRDLAAQTRFGKTRNELFSCADQLDRLRSEAETVEFRRTPGQNPGALPIPSGRPQGAAI
jgi:hypothetical protein